MSVFTWFPNTPTEHAVDTSDGPNHTAAKRAGKFNMNTWELATTVWPIMVMKNRSGLADMTFNQAPIIVPNEPANIATRSPYKQSKKCTFLNRIC